MVRSASMVTAIMTVAVACGGITTPQIGGSVKRGTCRNELLNPPDAGPRSRACDECEERHCAKELEVAMGTDPATFGGVCGAIFTCICECSESDERCFSHCPAGVEACTDAFNNGRRCAREKCATECGGEL